MTEQFSSLTINHIPIHILPTKKFKTNHIGFYIRQPLEEEHHTKVALIPSILRRGSENHPTAQAIRQALDQLYGATLYSEVLKRGEQQVVVFRLEVANEHYLRDQTPLLEKSVELLTEIIYRPRVENGVFVQKYVDLEKDLLRRKLEQLKDDKIRYANKRCTEEMFKDEKFSLFTNGSLEQIPQLQSQDLYDYYKKMITSYPIEMFIVGDITKESVAPILEKQLDYPYRPDQPHRSTITHKKVGEEKVVLEKTKISQGKLHIGCRTHTVYADSDYIPLLVCNGVFGGYAHSKLFRNVREKESLAYYVNSSIESHIGLMMIMAGIEPNKFEKAVSIIKEQLTSMRNGEITEDELSQTKAVMINQIKESNDQPTQLMERYYNGIIGGMIRSSDEVIQAIQGVTKDQIQQVASKIEMDTIYFLTTDDKEVT